MAKKRREFAFQHVRTTGPMLPADVLQRVANEDSKLPGLKATDYGLAESERLGEAITRSWTRLLDIHKNFVAEMAATDPTDTAAAPTFKAWLKYLFQELGYGSLTATTQSRMVDETAYPISHQWKHVPIHLVGANVLLDRRTSGVTGASKSAPHSLTQEFINRSDEALWSIVSNGRQLRLLRDNVSMTRQAFAEFDLDGMFKGQSFADFRLLWLVLHASRFDVPADGQPHQCIIEQWHVEGTTVGTRVLGELSKGVREAIEALGRGFLARPANAKLQQALASGELGKQEYYRQLLRLVYRFVFLFVAESRDLLLDPKASKAAKDAYRRHYSAARLQELAGKLRGNRHPDLYESLKLVMAGLGGPKGCPQIGIMPLGGYLWSPAAIGLLGESSLSNHALLAAVRALSYIVDKDGRRTVDYRNLGSEELGGVYEQLLELHPEINPTAPYAGKRFVLEVSAGNERKTSGSHYTPDSLVQVCLDTALEPLLAERLAGKKGPDAEKAILALKVVDTAVGSGHFLIGAAHRMAKRLAAVRTGDAEPSPEAYRTALRDVIRSCLYGVDLNPMAAELCRVALWLESMEPGKPLSFLDHHVKVGNSLLGTTPALMAKGIPDDAFEAIEGDDKKLCTQFRKANKREREDAQNKQKGLFAQPIKLGNLATVYANLAALPDDSLEQVEEKRKQYESLVSSSDYRSGRLLADAWCAAFVWKKTAEFDYPVTEEVYRAIEDNPHSQQAWMVDEIRRLAKQYGFFHWHLEFPDVFRVPAGNEKPEITQMGWSGGFDCVLGNPPWEQLEQRSGSGESQYSIAATQHFIEASARYPYSHAGRKNLYGLFYETALAVARVKSFLSLILPSGVLQDQPAANLTRDLMKEKRLAFGYDFQNRKAGTDGTGWFPAVFHKQRFTILAVWPSATAARFVFDTVALSDIHEQSRIIPLTHDDVIALCVDDFKVPMFRNAKDSVIVKAAYQHGAMLSDLLETPSSDVTATLLFNADEDIREQRLTKVEAQAAIDAVRVYEGSHIQHFDHRFATSGEHGLRSLSLGEKKDPAFIAQTDIYLPRMLVAKRIASISPESPEWFLAIRRQASVTNTTTLIAAVIPACGAEGSLSVMCFHSKALATATIISTATNSFILNYITRLRQAGPNVNKGLYSLLPIIDQNRVCAFLGDCGLSLGQWLLPRFVELSYTAWDLELFGRACGYPGPPYVWDENRRFQLRAELDAAYFHLYMGTPAEWLSNAMPSEGAGIASARDTVSYVMDTFPHVMQKDVEAHGTYRTKDTILSIYDEMAEAIRTGKPYQTRLDPPPADPSCRHPESTRPSWAKPIHPDAAPAP
jgi:hypothetical protein